jgi:general stress protein 26
MTMPDDAAAFLARYSRAFLLTRRRDGSPTIHPMVAFFDDGRVTMTTYRKSAKARNVERDPRAAVLVHAERPGSARGGLEPGGRSGRIRG